MFQNLKVLIFYFKGKDTRRKGVRVRLQSCLSIGENNDVEQVLKSQQIFLSLIFKYKTINIS